MRHQSLLNGTIDANNQTLMSILEEDAYDSESEEVEGDGLERACDTLIMCIITTLNNGLRNGGGIGDVLRKPSSHVSFRHPSPPPQVSASANR